MSVDLGTNFTSQLTREFERHLDYSPQFNSPFHPNATGIVEHGVGNIKAIVGKLAFDHPNQRQWYLPHVLWALHEAVNATTDLSRSH